MRLKFYHYLSFFSILFILTACNKELSFENNPFVNGTNTSSFIYSNIAGKCITPVITGGYTINTKTTINNTVLLQVDVTVVGTYAIATPVINGLSFTAKGVFTDTGIKTILLTANGTPTNSGTFTYTPGLGSCSFSIVVNTNGIAVFTFPSSTNSCVPDVIGGIYFVGEPLTTNNKVIFTVNVTTTGNYNLNTKVINGISFSATGNFSTVGLHTLTLIGIGTPIALGSNSYMLQANSTCSFIIIVGTGFINCTINGLNTSFTYRVSAKQSTPLTIDINGSIGTNSSENILISLFKPVSPIKTGDIFNPASLISGKNYLINYTDPLGLTWSAVNGSTPNPFTVTIVSKTSTVINGTFSGDISQIGVTGGPVKTITAGVFNIIMQ